MMTVTWAIDQGSPDRPNEDFVATAAGGAVGAVVLDGMSIDMRIETGCVHGRPWFVRQLGLRLLDAMLDDTPPSAALFRAIAGTADAHGGACDLGHTWTPASTVVALRTRAGLAEYVVLGDSTLLLETAGGVEPVTTDGWFAAADPRIAERARPGSVPLSDLHAAALLTDGATRLVDLFGLEDWPATLGTLAKKGPAALITRVRKAENDDPDGQRWPRSKPHDDAAVAYCRF